MTVTEFLRKNTEVHELCIVRDSGYIVMSVYIDYEDLYRINNYIGSKVVKSDIYGTIPIINHNREISMVDCHYIDI